VSGRLCVPRPDATWDEIQEFAQEFNGYERFGTERCGVLANASVEAFKRTGRLEVDLDLLRNALFFEQRRFRHFGFDPDGEDMRYVRALVAAIATKTKEEHMITEEQIRDAFGFAHKAKLDRKGSYTKVYGPSARLAPSESYVSVESNGAVCFASPIAEQMDAERRPEPPVFVAQHPLGAAIGPSYGRFLHGLTPEEIQRRFSKARDLTAAVVEAFAKAGVKW
jgi:hypothetical protein